jgi:predicted acylesterase/phospholipase RssA
MPPALFQHRAMGCRSRPAGIVLALVPLALGATVLLAPAQTQQAQQTQQLGFPRDSSITQPETPKRPARKKAQPKKEGAAKKGEPIPREPFTAQDESLAAIPGLPSARFWADSEKEFSAALPAGNGPWLALSSGGADGAFGAGLMVGLSAAGKRPDYALVTGVSSGALMAPFIFAGAKYDEQLRGAYTTINSGDVFEVNRTPESFLDTWPLKDLIAKRVTPELLADVAAEHAKGRRLFVITTNLDSERPVGWNMGAIASAGGQQALKLFREVLLAAGSIPGAFPPVLIEVEANGRRFQEMHADGGMFAQFYVAPDSLLAATSAYRLPTSALYVVVNVQLASDFQLVERSLMPIILRGVSAIVKTLTRVMIHRTYSVARRSGVDFYLATVPESFQTPAQGAFDTEYMKALFNAGFEQGQSAMPFSREPTPVSVRPSPVPR